MAEHRDGIESDGSNTGSSDASTLMAGLGLASVGFNHYFRFMLPLMGIWLAIMLVVFAIAAF